MFDPTGSDTVGRFNGLAGLYDRHRPDYPAAALDFIAARRGLLPGARIVDVGCGTGISTRMIAAKGFDVIGLEPNAEMRAVAAATPVSPGVPTPHYRDGRAEATGLVDASVDLVLVAQAFHWFRALDALREFHRVLKPGGWVVLMWNEQDRADPFTAAYGDALRHYSPDPILAARSQCATGDQLLACRLFQDGERVEFPHAQQMDLDQLIGRAFSVSFAPTEPPMKRRLAEELRMLFAHHQRDGRVVMRYRTTLYSARSASAIGLPRNGAECL